MKYRAIGIYMAVLLTATVSAQAADFTAYENWPDPAEGKFSTSAAGLSDGRLVVWNGDAIFLQDAPLTDAFTQIASGYEGDPGFVAVHPDGHTLALSPGYGDGSPQPVYLFDANAPADYSAAAEVSTPSTHFSGIWLNEDMLIYDWGDLSTTYLTIVDLSAELGAKEANSAPKTATVASFPIPGGAKATAEDVVDKGGWSQSLALDSSGTTLYFGNAEIRQLYKISVSALVNAFNSSTTLPIDDNAIATVGEEGAYFGGGVCGVMGTGHLLVFGAESWGGPGGIQVVDPDTGDVVDLFQPAGNTYTGGIYNAAADEIIASVDQFYSAVYTDPPEMPVAGLAGLALLASLVALAARKRVS